MPRWVLMLAYRAVPVKFLCSLEYSCPVTVGLIFVGCLSFLPVWNVLVGTVITKLFCETKVDGVDEVPFFPKTHQEVVWLDITVDKVLAMDKLDPTYL